ncbi:MAG: lysostaphin resistance A-like protein [Promethearchaeota archaeon]
MEKWRTFAGRHPFAVLSLITLICVILSLIDIFILRIDELWGEIIISKALGFFIILIYLWSVQRSVAAIGLHKTMIFQALFIGAFVSTIMMAIYFTAGFLVLIGSNVKVEIIFSPNDPKAGVEGGVLFGLWLVFGNVINCCMEEGLFRGLMTRKFLTRMDFWKANFLQAALFGAWHLRWPLKYYITGQMTLMQAVFNAISINFGAPFLLGQIWGYMYYKTNSLWPSWISHFIWNSTLNLLIFNIPSGTDEAIVNAAIVLSGGLSILTGLMLMFLIKYLADKWNIPKLAPWDQENEILIG